WKKYQEQIRNTLLIPALRMAPKATFSLLKLHPSAGSLGILSILCLPSGGNNTKRFHFSQDGVEMTSSHEEPVKSSRDSGVLTLNMSVAFLYAKDNKSLRFACRYEENMTGRWITSPWSQTVNITGGSFPEVESSAAEMQKEHFAKLDLTRQRNLVERYFSPFCFVDEPAPSAQPVGYAPLVLLVPFLAAPLDPDLTYALVRKSSILIPLEPRTENRLKTKGEYQVMYSE
ncbi:hypothetical protein E2320_003642, partial [Naja naja]